MIIGTVATADTDTAAGKRQLITLPAGATSLTGAIIPPFQETSQKSWLAMALKRLAHAPEMVVLFDPSFWGLVPVKSNGV